MSASDGAPRALPANPSQEHLRKQAKRHAKAHAIGLAAAQRKIARDYGCQTWSELMHRVDEARAGGKPAALSPLAEAARAGQVAEVRRLLADGHKVEGERGDNGTPLWHACASEAPAGARVAVVGALLAAGANARRDDADATALHAAASRGPLRLVELLIIHDALEWQPDRKGRPALDAARHGTAADKDAIVELLARPVIRDPSFRAAVTALHRGDATELARLLDAEPRLLRDRIREPECYRLAKRHQYFRDPALFWFIADNPTLIERMPDNMVEIAGTMIARGVAQHDLDYALELVMTSGPAEKQGLQVPLIEVLLAAGATATEAAIDSTLGHRLTGPARLLLGSGHILTAPIAAALGERDTLARLLSGASGAEIQKAFGLAVINRQNEAARMALDAGADPNGFLPVHGHSTALHQAAIDENLELIELLLERGARADIPDKLWHSTPLGWAVHQGKSRSRALLERDAAARQRPG